LPRTQSATLTEAELRIMNVLWRKGPATVHEVLQAIPERPALAYNSVLTIVRILEKKGYVGHVKDKDTRAFIYTAKVAREDATRSEVRRLVTRFFGDSHELLVLNILEDKTIDAEELDRLRAMLNEETASDEESEESR
jgi:BlaI family penicillinase repressor